MMDAFYDYPVMRWVIGDVGADYDRHLRVMLDVFAASRFLRDYPVLGVRSKDFLWLERILRILRAR